MSANDRQVGTLLKIFADLDGIQDLRNERRNETHRTKRVKREYLINVCSRTKATGVLENEI